MNDSRPITFFTHVPKTAGTAQFAATFQHAFDPEQIGRFRGYKHLVLSKCRFSVLRGHYAYGTHHCCEPSGAFEYFTMLREPVSRLMSYYWFYKQSSAYAHPVYEDVATHTLLEFSAKPKYQNVQTRFLAGIHYQYLGKTINLNNWLGRRVLNRAIDSLPPSQKHRWTTQDE